MIAALAERAIVGAQEPRLCWMPECSGAEAWDFSLAEECIVWATETLRVFLDEWQKLLLRMMLARRPDGTWACRQFVLICSRQNGKSWVLLIRCLFGLLVMGEREIVFSAHSGDTIQDAYDKAQSLLLDPDDSDRVKAGLPAFQTYSSDGRQRLTFADGAKMRFRTRTKTGGRGLTGSVLILDEAQELLEEHMSALGPILGSKSMTGNPQVVFSGSAGHYGSSVFGRQRRKMTAGGAPRLGGAEWSIDEAVYQAADVMARDAMLRDPACMAQANPTFNVIRPDGSGGISEEYLLDELDNLGFEGAAREHYGVGTWPRDDGAEWVIPRTPWSERAKPEHPLPAGKLVLAVSGSWGFRSTSISATVGGTEDCHSWLERQDSGTDWAVDEVVRLAKSRETAAVMVDPGGPAAGLIPRIKAALEPLGVRVEEMSGREMATACGDLLDAVTSESPAWSHRGQLEVTAALAGAKKKDLGAGLWLFDKAKSESDIAPLESLAWARFGWVQYGRVDDGPSIW